MITTVAENLRGRGIFIMKQNGSFRFCRGGGGGTVGEGQTFKGRGPGKCPPPPPPPPQEVKKDAGSDEKLIFKFAWP